MSICAIPNCYQADAKSKGNPLYQFNSLISLGKKDNLSLDIGFFDKKILTPEHINTHYAAVPPLLSLEVDIKIDTNKLPEMDYVHKKTKKLLEKGTSKVIWIFTGSQRVLIATPEDD